MRLYRLLSVLWIAALTLALRALRVTWRVQICGAPPRRGQLLAFWHEDQLALCGAPPRPAPAVLVSRSRDGALAAEIARRLGLEPVRGSSSRGAVAGALGLVRRLRAGRLVALAVDGPRGPRQRTSDQPLVLARLGGGAAIPAAAAARRVFRLGSWDRLQIPAPFTQVVICYGPPVVSDLQRALAGVSQAAQQALTAPGGELPAPLGERPGGDGF